MPKVYFENHFEEYSSSSTANLLDPKNRLSDEFTAKLDNFISSKLNYLHTKMQNEIFHDTTVYTGSAGLSYYYIMRFLSENVDKDLLKTAAQYICMEKLKGRRISFLCGDAGPLALAVVISYKLGAEKPGNMFDYKTLTQRLLSLMSLKNESPDEILYGKSGYLFALLFVNKYVGNDTIPANSIEKITNSIIKSGKKFSEEIKSESPLLWEWHDKIYLGAAHGVAGILYMLLQARAYISQSDMQNFIKPSLDWVLNLQYPSYNFPSSYGSQSGDRLVQWCHGAPGFVPLCILAHQVFKDDKYLNIAIKSGEVIWQRGLCSKGYSICHGVSGNAYAFIQLYQATKEPKFLYRAACFMNWCIEERPGTELHSPDRPASLFEGLIGRIFLAQDLKNIESAKFPALTV